MSLHIGLAREDKHLEGVGEGRRRKGTEDDCGENGRRFHSEFLR